MVHLVIAICATLIILTVIFTGRKLSAKIGNVHFELTPNGGKSFRDEIQKDLKEIRSNVGNLCTRVKKLESICAPKRKRDSQGRFISDE